MLKSRGVEVIFGIPGVHNQEMYRGIEEAGITHVLARHEQGAGFMADGYARATGKPGIAYVITGPGLCNIMTPMGQAYSDSVPMLVIASCLDDVAARKGQLHQMRDQEGAAATVCDWSETARSAEAAYALVDRAFEEYRATSRRRPKALHVPIHLLEADAPAAPAPLKEFARTKQTSPDVQQILDRLSDAQRPLFVFGGGVRAASDVAEVLRKTAAASFVSYAGRGIVPPDNPLYYGSSLARPSSAEEIAKSDLVIAIGTELAEVDLWRHLLGHRAPLIRVDIDPVVLADPQQADLRVAADADAVLEALNNRLPAKAKSSAWNEQEVAAVRSRWRAEVDAERPGIVPVCEALRDCVPPDTMIYSDMTQMAYVAKEVWDMPRPGHWHHPYGFGTLGYATPAAIGGAVARRGKPTLAIIGDYGFHYTMQELGVAVELGLSLPILLWDNAKLKEIEDSMVRAQIAPNAVIARNPDFCKLAEAFGARAEAPTNLAEMQKAVRAAFEATGPTLIYLTPDLFS
jgi:acetolactate synthase-1/2/3 large subunit/5-guanidino-2-oxopentanoate decarboxylase